jgi:hypothetical protein
MSVKYTNHYLNVLEELFAESDYILRYEKGQFKSGYCILKDTKIAIVNRYFPLEGKINSLIEIIRSIAMDSTKFSPKSKKVYSEITQTQLDF